MVAPKVALWDGHWADLMETDWDVYLDGCLVVHWDDLMVDPRADMMDCCLADLMESSLLDCWAYQKAVMTVH